MAVNYVKGQILSSNLERDGIDLSISNANVGINTLTPSSEFEVAGVITVGNITISNVGNISAGNVNINNLADPVANSDAATKQYVIEQIANNVTNIGNLVVNDTTITTEAGNANINIQTLGTGLFQILDSSGFVMPVGNTAQRPSPAVAGTMRFNNELERVEYYDGAEWDVIAGGITNQTLNGDGSTLIFVLNRESTTAATLVMLNGIVQLPSTSYTVTGNSLNFVQAPQISDTIDVRFL
jgi:hypothetical protein